MKLVFAESAWEDHLWFQERDRQLLKRINQLIRETFQTPFEGMDKPEPLKADLSGYWSRRIDDQHRLVYGVIKNELVIIACRYHYSKG
ncbi:MAG: toxin YoeB [Anaerolineae bacterium UTCFX3]|jgi:toxin YoeB|nr:MAG: toxin YoeB [Anaerolineae bacterium UTCFX3]